MAVRGPDYLLLGVGIVLFLGGAWGIAKYGGPSTPSSPFIPQTVSWKTKGGSLLESPLSFTEGTARTQSVNVSHFNVTKIVLQAKCSDPNPGSVAAAVSVELSVKLPTGREEKKGGGCGSDIRIELSFARVPEETTVSGSPSEVEKRLEAFRNASAMGTYEIRVSATRSTPPSPLPLPNLQASGTVEGTIEWYEAKLTPVAK